MVSRWLPRAALVSAAAGALSIAMATAAWASGEIPLNDAHQGSTAGGFNEQNCGDERFADLPDGYDGWHFVLPEDKEGNGSFVSLTLHFTSGDGPETVSMSVVDDDSHSDYAFYKAGSRYIHAYLFTPAGWTLNDGTAEISGTADKDDFFNLSHTCPGTSTTPSPSASATPSPSESTTTPGESPTSPAASTPAPGGDSLPLTGTATGIIAGVGLALIGGGAAMVFLRRRRDKVTFTA